MWGCQETHGNIKGVMLYDCFSLARAGVFIKVEGIITNYMYQLILVQNIVIY